MSMPKFFESDLFEENKEADWMKWYDSTLTGNKANSLEDFCAPFNFSESDSPIDYTPHGWGVDASSTLQQQKYVTIKQITEVELAEKQNAAKTTNMSTSCNVSNLDLTYPSYNTEQSSKGCKLNPWSHPVVAQSSPCKNKSGRRDIKYKKVLRSMRKFYKHKLLEIDNSIGKIKYLRQKYDVIKKWAREFALAFFSSSSFSMYIAALAYPNETSKMLKLLKRKYPDRIDHLENWENVTNIIRDLLYHFSINKLQQFLEIPQLSNLAVKFLEWDTTPAEFRPCIETIRALSAKSLPEVSVTHTLANK